MADYTYTVTLPASGVFAIDGEEQAEIALKRGKTYQFSVSDATMSGDTFRFSTTSDGTHNSGAEFIEGVTVSGTAGSASAYVELEVNASSGTTPDVLYYYNGASAGDGGKIVNTDATYVETQNIGAKIPLPGDSENVWAAHLNAGLRKIDARATMFPNEIAEDVEIPDGYQAVWAGPIEVGISATLTITGTLIVI
jgi:hypothetical protein